jgi:hypothetical protein
MDTLTFVSSLVGSLVWPVVVIVLLVLLRPRLEGLADRLQELSLPGGTKAKFEKRLDAARRESEKVSAGGRSAKRKSGSDKSLLNDPYVALATSHPDLAILESFKEVEHVIMEFWDKVPGVKKVWMDALQPLVSEGLLSAPDIDLFHHVRILRNLATHAGEKRITTAEAIEYRSLCQTLSTRFREAFEQYVARSKTV